MATNPRATRQAPPATTSPDAVAPVVHGQIIDPQQLPLDSTQVRYRAPAGAKGVKVRARIPGIAAGRYREPGDVFVFPLAPTGDGEHEPLPDWVDAVDGADEQLEQATQRATRPVRPELDPRVPLMSHMDPPEPELGPDTLSSHVIDLQ